MSRTPAELAETLASLPVRIASVRVQTGAVALDDYPGGPRPTSVVSVSGDGHVGLGENVAFTDAEHADFAATAEVALGAAMGHRQARVGDALDATFTGSRHARAALEAALIDLALRQAGATLAELTGSVAERRLRFVESFAIRRDPTEHVRRLRAAGHTADLKIDLDPSWDEATREALAREPGIAILDFKGRGDAALVRAWSALVGPTVILEDPPGAVADLGEARIARDASLADAAAVADALRRGEAVNLKAPRMGGPLEVLRALDLARRAGGTCYLGGMFEVGVGRRQARQLAALYAGEAPNDLALVGRALAERSPAEIRLDTAGFGAEL